MIEERKKILNKINSQIGRIKTNLLDKFPAIHEIDDGIIVRYFTDWDMCDENTKIKYKKMINENNPEEIIIFMYIPKGAHIECRKRKYIKSITCLTGELELDIDNKFLFIDKYTKKYINSDEFSGRALENTYLLTSNVS
jgi:hypothetical protein